MHVCDCYLFFVSLHNNYVINHIVSTVVMFISFVVCLFHCSLILMFVLWDLSQALIELVVVVLLVLTNYNIRSYRSYHHCDISLINISLCLTFHLSAPLSSLSFHFPPAIPILPINIITLLTLFVCWVVVTIFIYNHPLFTVCKRIVSKILALNQ
jgi:hypothetical protein